MRVRAIVQAAVVGLVLATLTTGTAAQGAGEPGVVHFAAAGDFGQGTGAKGVLTAMHTAAPDLAFALGDLSYGTTGAEQSWCDLVTSKVGAGFPFELLSGNHESNGLNGQIDAFAACLPNRLPGVVGTYGREYYVDVPQVDPIVRFVMISPGLAFPDGVWSYAAGTPHYNWTAAAIDGARSSGIPWVVVGMHKPCISVGEYGCRDIGTGIVQLLLSKRVDLVLNGHEHLYQRTRQLGLRTGCTGITPNAFDADCVADSDAAMSQGAGTVFATVGTGGIALRDVNAADPEAGYFAASAGGNKTPSHGFLDLRATTTDLKARFVATDGSFTDGFTVTRGTPPPDAAFVADSFGRTVANGLGTADAGGAWTTVGTASNFSVGGGAGQLNLRAAGTKLTGYLGATKRIDTDLRMTLALDKVPAGNPVYLTLTGRRVGTNNEYRTSMVVQPTGRVTASLQALRGSSTAATVASAVVVPGVTYTAGKRLNVRMQVTGANPTTLRFKAWPATAAEPSSWLRTATDMGAGLQTAGAVGLTAYLSSATTNAPVVVRMSDLTARPVA
jgi:hypothetical protein